MKQFMLQIDGTEGWFNNIVGIIEGFVEYGLAESGSWLSVVDAGILQGIQDGYAQSAGIADSNSINLGEPAWSAFFDALWEGAASEDRLISLWGTAESISTNYGVGVANDRNLIPNAMEFTFLLTGNLYRYAASQWEGGLGTPTSFVFAVVGGLSGNDSDLSVDAGYKLGRFFNDPRSLHNSHSPVYWYSTFLWEFQEGLVWR